LYKIEIDAIDEALSKLVEKSILEEKEYTITPAVFFKIQKNLDYIDKLLLEISSEYGIYNAMEMSGIGINIHFAGDFKVDQKYKFKARLPKKFITKLEILVK